LTLDILKLVTFISWHYTETAEKDIQELLI
jgi:hypothetical protein